MYEKCSFLKVTFVCPPIGPSETVLLKSASMNIGSAFSNCDKPSTSL